MGRAENPKFEEKKTEENILEEHETEGEENSIFAPAQNVTSILTNANIRNFRIEDPRYRRLAVVHGFWH